MFGCCLADARAILSTLSCWIITCSATRLERYMSRKQVVAGLLLLAVVGANLAVWLWRPWERPRNEFDWPDAWRCDVVCINQTDKPIDLLEFRFSGNQMKFRPLDGGADQLFNPGGLSGQVVLAPVTVGLQPGERGPCCQIFGGGKIEVSAFAVEQLTRQPVAADVPMGGSVVLTFEPGGKVRVASSSQQGAKTYVSWINGHNSLGDLTKNRRNSSPQAPDSGHKKF